MWKFLTGHNSRAAMHPDAYKEKLLTAALVRIVNNRKGEGISIEQILNESGISRTSVISVYDMVEVRALVLYALDIDRCDTQLREVIIYFIAKYPVFRWSELRYQISDPEKAIEAILHELKYVSLLLEIDGKMEFVCASRWITIRTARKQLAHRDRVGDTAFYEFLNYKTQR
ncbi:hypothetical protein [Thalassomonas haliotis]|uniref:Uncharacterized protein n=1 Tax=Thalassomonas haliotis TaxID=485448 RepID=A0ABY7VIV0_9GAMM|nr:hypothetical protein [Thalassomonas haliotis]WDE13501.1 hypothetical protein H3N35_08725 [Thalassomonas haliotis]